MLQDSMDFEAYLPTNNSSAGYIIEGAAESINSTKEIGILVIHIKAPLCHVLYYMQWSNSSDPAANIAMSKE